MSLSHEIIQRIKDTSEITAVISERMNLTKKGVNYVGVCPFHADKSPSLTVSSAKQMYKCFACGAGGDVIKFIQESDGLTFYEACKFLARRANIELPADTEQTPEERAAAAKRESMLLHTKQEQNGYSQNQTKQFLAYLAERQLSLDIATAFGLGHSTNGFFADRITYPFYDISGNCVGHTGRALVWNKECQYPKYKNSPESPIFHKERLLFGLHQAKKEIAQRGKALLVEGQNDVLQLHQKGLGNAVCGSGTAFSEAQARLLQRFTSEVTMIYDGDAAGAKAAIKALQVFLPVGLSVNIITLPDGHDPDSFAKQFEPDKLKIVLKNMEKPWFNYMLTVYPYDANPEIAEPHLKELCELIALVPSDVKRKMYISAVASEFHIGADVVKRQIKPAPKTDTWKDGFYGFEEAKAILDEYDKIGMLTFLESEFIDLVDEQPIIYYKGRAKKFAIQLLRKRFSEFVVNSQSGNFEFGKQESTDLEVLREMHIEGIKITIEGYSENQQQWAFTDWYLEQYSKLFPTINSTEKSEFVRRCIEVIAYTEATMRTMNGASYASTLGIKIGAYNDLLKPILASKRDKNEMEKQRVDMEANIMDFDPGALPSYVMEDEIMAKVYQQSGFYPLLKKDSTPCAYMFKNDKGEGHSCVSDFYMVPLLHIYSNDDAANKRVIQLNHIHYGKKYVEWQSSVLANLGKVQEKLINAGAYNFDGSLLQFKRIWRNMSYNFTHCRELRVFGQQTEEFWAFTNAIYHEVTSVDEYGNKKTERKVEYVDELGVTTHQGENYYSPAFSKIFLDERRDSDAYEQDRYFIYKEIADADRIDFAQWASLMDEVYKINDNGKWAILFDILACFRDFIYGQKKCFTTLFLIGPTGSGKSQIAYSMRALFMSPDAPTFNLNSGTDAAFFMVLERNRNVISIMEEYNDQNISQAKFQGLKSAILDGEGKIKVKDMANKTLDSSKINAIPLPLGQEAPQQDDGSLGNRSILCDVPYKAKGEFSAEEIQVFDKLKEHERIGLSNVLLQILDLRPTVKKYYIAIFNEEIKKVKAAISVNVGNTEGLTRVVNSVTMLVAMCRLVEERTDLKLPFTYQAFFKIACQKIIKQMETLGKANKLNNYFATIAFLITQGSIKIGRELKVVTPKNEISIKRGTETANVKLPTPETKVLYLHFESVYPLYVRSAGKEALSQQSLRSYFESHPAFLGSCKTTKFTWYEEKLVPRKSTDIDGNERLLTDRIMEKKVNASSAYVFNYDTLVDLMQIDFERQALDEPIDSKEFNPDGDLPF